MFDFVDDGVKFLILFSEIVSFLGDALDVFLHIDEFILDLSQLTF
jgi:hypothetical protein